MPITQSRLHRILSAANDLLLRHQTFQSLAITTTLAATKGEITWQQACAELMAFMQSIPTRSAETIIAVEMTHYRLTHRSNELAKERMARRRARINSTDLPHDREAPKRASPKPAAIEPEDDPNTDIPALTPEETAKLESTPVGQIDVRQFPPSIRTQISAYISERIARETEIKHNQENF